VGLTIATVNFHGYPFVPTPGSVQKLRLTTWQTVLKPSLCSFVAEGKRIKEGHPVFRIRVGVSW
jgi:hypothetical protein